MKGLGIQKGEVTAMTRDQEEGDSGIQVRPVETETEEVTELKGMKVKASRRHLPVGYV